MKKVYNKLRQSSMLRFVVSFSGLILLFSGCGDDDTALPEVKAGFTHTIDATLGIVTFTSTSKNANTYHWNFGDETTSEEVNPVKKYVNGTYAVTLTTANPAGATDAFSDTLTIFVKEAISLPVTFDGENTQYQANTLNGASFDIVDNPYLSGSNNKPSKVGAITNSGAAFEGISFDLGEPVSLINNNKSVILNFWSQDSAEVLLRLEGNTGDQAEKTVVHHGSGWETLAFDFDSEGIYFKLALFADTPETRAGTFFIDNIIQEATICREVTLKLPIDFDCDSTDYTFETFGGAGYRIITNPEVSCVNNSVSLVGEIINSGKVEEGGSFMLDNPVSFSSDNAVVIKVYSTVAVPVSMRFGKDDGASVTATENHNGKGWEWLLFEFDAGGEFSTLSLLIDKEGETSGTFYIDDIEQGDENVLTCIEPEDFEDGLLTNGDFEDGAAPWRVGVGTDAGLAPVKTVEGNTYYSVSVTSPNGNRPFDISLNQKLPLTQGESYTLTFDAWSDRDRTIVAGIGQSAGDFKAATNTVSITGTRTTYTATFNNIGFGETDNRVLFYSNGEAGLVNIDNVSLFVF